MFVRTVSSVASLLVAAAAAEAQIPPGYRAVQISSGEYWDLNARLNNRGQIVFERWNTTRRLFEAWFWEDGVLSPLAVDELDNRVPDINDDGTIVWSRAIGPPGPWGPTYEIVMLRQGQLTRLTENSLDDEGPRINNAGHVAWYQLTAPSAITSEILFYDGVTLTQITNDTPLQRASMSPAINELDHIVWTRYDFTLPSWRAEIMMYDSGQVRRISPDSAVQQSVELNNAGQVVWDISTGGGQNGLRLWEAGTTTLLTDWGGWAHINDAGHIAFYRWYPSSGRFEAWLYRAGTYYQVTSGEQPKNIPSDINHLGEFVYHSGASGLTRIIYVQRLSAGDLDGDGDVDLSDFLTFQLCFAGSGREPAPSCPPGVDADFDEDGDVDLADFLVLQQNFTGAR